MTTKKVSIPHINMGGEFDINNAIDFRLAELRHALSHQDVHATLVPLNL
jgi:hypothetical protein